MGSRPSAALWLPLTWAFVIGSKPISLWFGVGGTAGAGEYQDSAVDKLVFLGLILAGLGVVMKRGMDWGAAVRENRWLAFYFLYLLCSTLWADDPVVAFKRWFKDLGHIVMVLVILTEQRPAEAVRRFLARTAYLLLPLSVLLIKYYPELSRHYDLWTNQALYVGVTTDKNSLGMTLCVCGLSIFCLTTIPDGNGIAKAKGSRGAWLTHVLLLLMVVWLLSKARSSTASVCSLLGACFIVAMRSEGFRRRFERAGLYVLGLVLCLLAVYLSDTWEDLIRIFAEAVGRDPTLHGRTAIWQALLNENTSPIFGAGYYSFWSPDRVKRLSEKYYYALNEAHNGYIETYLNLGLIGLVTLLGLVGSGFRRVKVDIMREATFAPLFLAFLIATVLYGVSEAVFNRLSLVWFAMLLAIIRAPLRQTAGDGVSRLTEPLRAANTPNATA